MILTKEAFHKIFGHTIKVPDILPEYEPDIVELLPMIVVRKEDPENCTEEYPYTTPCPRCSSNMYGHYGHWSQPRYCCHCRNWFIVKSISAAWRHPNRYYCRRLRNSLHPCFVLSSARSAETHSTVDVRHSKSSVATNMQIGTTAESTANENAHAYK